MTEPQSRLAIGLAVVVAIAYDIFFWREGLGNNWLWFATVFLAAVTGVLVMAKRWHNGWAVIPALASLGFAASVALYENEFATFIAPTLSVLSGLGYIGLVGFWPGIQWHIRNFAFFEHFETIFTGWRSALHNATHGREGLLRQVGFGLLIAAPFIIIFALLFSSADAIFADWLKRLNIWEYGWRAVRTFILITLGVGLFMTLVKGNGSGEVRVWVWKMPVATVAVVLGLLNLLFAAFVAIQLKYYFGQAAYVLSNGLTFADYARQGFFDLARVLVLAAVIVVAIYRSYAGIARSWLVTILQTAFVAQVAVVAVSALKRMSLYQEMYGFTTLRLYVEWFIYFTLALLVLAAAALIVRFSFRRFVGAVLALGALAGVIVSWVNVDAVIAKENITRWQQDEKKGLDVEYLGELSLDAVPAIGELLKTNRTALTPNQALLLKDYWENKQKQVASTTPLSYTWSTMQAKLTFAEVNPQLGNYFADIGGALQKYERFVQERINYTSCPTSVKDDVRRVLLGNSSAAHNYNTECAPVLPAQAGQALTHYAVLTTIANNLPPQADIRPYKYMYYVIEGDNRTLGRILYTKELKYGEDTDYGSVGLDEKGETYYTLATDGHVIQKDWKNLKHYRLQLNRGADSLSYGLAEPIQL